MQEPSNLPPGVTDSMLPGNRPEDLEADEAFEREDNSLFENVERHIQVRHRKEDRLIPATCPECARLQTAFRALHELAQDEEA